MKIFKHALLTAGLFSIVSCSNDDDATPTTPQTFLEQNATLVSEVKTTYANIVLASYEDALSEAQNLKTAIDAFVANPSQATMDAAKQAWLDAREPYGQTEAYRFANGPIDNPDLELGGPEGLLNAWPLDESYIDDVSHSQDINTNIINDTTTFPIINASVLEDLNEANDRPENVSVGYHAIEFLLWGQDTLTPTDGPEGTTGGNRPFTDFADDGGTLQNQDRRRAYLVACAELIIGHLQDLVSQWDTSGSNYRTTFLAFSDEEAIRNIISGAAILVGPELGRERVFVALNEESQEDEHSCFSDNTHRDLRLNFKGVQNVYQGSYARLDGSMVSGSSIQDLGALLTDDSASIYTTLNTLFSEAAVSVEATGIPFDFAIFDPASRPAIDQASTDLLEVGNQLGLLSAAFGASIGTVEIPD